MTAASQILILFVLPLALLVSGIVPIWYRFIVLGVVTGGVIAITRLEHWSLRDLGIRMDNLVSSFIPYAVFTVLALAGLFLYAKFLGLEIAHPQFGYGSAAILSVVLSVAQEFLFRSFFIPKLRILFRSLYVVIVLNACIFAFLHVLYPDFLSLLPVALIGGIGFAAMYSAFPNLYLVSASHAILNFATAILGIFVIPSMS